MATPLWRSHNGRLRRPPLLTLGKESHPAQPWLRYQVDLARASAIIDGAEHLADRCGTPRSQSSWRCDGPVAATGPDKRGEETVSKRGHSRTT
jgi:hypothetical protein